MDGDIDQLRRPPCPVGVVDSRVHLKRLITAPAQHPFDQPTRRVRGQQRAGNEDAKRVDGVVLEIAFRYTRALRKQEFERLVELMMG